MDTVDSYSQTQWGFNQRVRERSSNRFKKLVMSLFLPLMLGPVDYGILFWIPEELSSNSAPFFWNEIQILHCAIGKNSLSSSERSCQQLHEVQNCLRYGRALRAACYILLCFLIQIFVRAGRKTFLSSLSLDGGRAEKSENLRVSPFKNGLWIYTTFSEIILMDSTFNTDTGNSHSVLAWYQLTGCKIGAP